MDRYVVIGVMGESEVDWGYFHCVADFIVLLPKMHHFVTMSVSC